jgi:hypothetical protein
MSTQTITKRGIESALYVCPLAAASGVDRERARVGAVSPFQGTGLPFAGTGLPVAGIVRPMADVAVRTTQQQLDPLHPGDTARRPPA